MSVNITKDFMYNELKKLLKSLFSLSEVRNISIKGIMIPSFDDEDKISKALNECFHDIYSDVDIDIEIKLNLDEYNRSSPIYSDCLSRLGLEKDILGMTYYCTEPRGEVIRICKTNGMRFDLIINAVCSDETDALPHGNVNENIMAVDNFWFVAIQALGKLQRKDYLISSHLTHMLIQEGLVLQMIIRDNEKNTNIHRYGYEEDLEYLSILNKDEIPFAKKSNNTYNYISELLYSAVKSYDMLCSSLNDSYKSKLENYLDIWYCYCQNSTGETIKEH